jgi:hypothetical protein
LCVADMISRVRTLAASVSHPEKKREEKQAKYH